jgi:hypothetical protein
MQTLEHDKTLRYIADLYEQTQRLRIETGERIRAILQGKDETWGTPDEEVDAAAILKRIAKGEERGPVPVLGRTYHRYTTEEAELKKDMMSALKSHPVWVGWMQDVKGIGPTLGCKLLATFDPERATSASAFWRYAGLATVPGLLYRCDTCGLEVAYPKTYKVTEGHQALHSTKKCKGKLQAHPEIETRCREPHTDGTTAVFNMSAKKLMYNVGTSFIKAGGPYERVYRKHRARLEVDRRGWRDQRKHYTALRITEKLFLSHLWEVWRESRGLPVRKSYAEQHAGHDGYISPWDFVEA